MSTETIADLAPGLMTPAAADVEALERTLRETLAVFGALRPEDFDRPSACAGWTLRTVLAHVTLGVAGIAGLLRPTPYEAGEDFESAVDTRATALAARPVAELLELFESAAPAVPAAFRAMSGQIAAMPLTMASAGTYPMGQMVDALIFDQTCHIRWDVLAPRGPIRRRLPELDTRRLSASVRWLVGGIPQMTTARFRELVTDPITIVLIGPGQRTFHLVARDGAVAVAVEDTADTRARATVFSTATDFILWGTGRESRRNRVRLAGDTAYAERVLDQFRVY
jgi:uncharacterized protein (TIGR03083 family)